MPSTNPTRTDNPARADLCWADPFRVGDQLTADGTYEGAEDVHALILGRVITGLSALS
jgi:hypothetical protein